MNPSRGHRWRHSSFGVSSLLSPFLVLVSVGLILGIAQGAGAHEEDVYEFTGAGWGHSIGMSQYGAYGQSLEGSTSSEIIEYYYSGVEVSTLDDLVSSGELSVTDPLIADSRPLWVGIRQNEDSFEVAPVGGPFELCRINDDDSTSCVDGGWLGGSALAWTISRSNTAPPEADPVWECRAGPSSTPGDPVLEDGNCNLDLRWGGTGQAVRIALDGDRCADPNAGLDRECFNNGVLHVRDAGVADGFHVVLGLGLEQYLYGLGEMPSSWPSAALEAQAMAGRSYAVFRLLGNEQPVSATTFDVGMSAARQAACWCYIYSTVIDQNYVGFAKEGAVSGGASWVAAVDATAGQVITHPTSSLNQATVIQAFYHSSSGGWTETNVTVWGGGEVVYLKEVEDGWSVDPAVANPYSSWTFTATASTLADLLGWEEVDDVYLINGPPAAMFMFEGMHDGVEVTEAISSAELYSGLGTRSPHIDGVTVERTVPFDDIDETIHRDAILAIFDAGITSGCDSTNYCPTESVNRAQMATFLARAMNLEPVEGAMFADVPASSVHAGSINAIAEIGITLGCGDGLFCPGDIVSRAQMATFLARALELEPIEAAMFSDVPVGGVHAPSINAIAEAGISVGCDEDLYCPDAPVSRAQMATFLAKAFIWSAAS